MTSIEHDTKQPAYPAQELWFVAGSQDLYGPEVLEFVETQSRAIAAALDGAPEIPISITLRAVVTSAAAIRRLATEANTSELCVGIVVWMHTFSPAKLWIAGLRALQKPLLHLHTQFNAELPWAEIDMDFMNLNQSAHGDREFAHLAARMRLRHKTVVGHWSEPRVRRELGNWARAACGWQESGRLRIARFGDNMREVAVTEGDKVEAQAHLGFSVEGFGVHELVAAIDRATPEAVERLLADYEREYDLANELAEGGSRRSSLVDAARIEAGLRAFLDSGGFGAFTDTFQDLHGLCQLPGIAVQRLMADGYGFGAEGDWKAAALVRILKVMSAGLEGGTSFMEDYTYDHDLNGAGARVLGAHMLEICPSIAAGRPSCEIHPLSIGDRDDPVRLVFTAACGPAVLLSLVDLGNRFRLVANEIDVVDPPRALPRLPVARALWAPHPDFATAAQAWLEAGGSHHSAFTAALDSAVLVDFADIAGLEIIVIDDAATSGAIRNQLRWNDSAYRISGG